MGKALKSKDPTEIEPGEYTVVLEEYAMGELLDYLAFMGFSALAVQEERSFLKTGEKITGDNITFTMMAPIRGALPIRIDFEGVGQAPGRPNKGTVWPGRPVYDSYTAGREPGMQVDRAMRCPRPTHWGRSRATSSWNPVIRPRRSLPRALSVASG